MVAIQDLLYQLRLADQSMTQLFERQLGTLSNLMFLN